MAMAFEELPRTVGGLREAHVRLLREWRSGEPTTMLEQARRLREVAREAGARIADLADRDEVQGIIDYWASAISGLPGQRFPELLQIESYRNENAARAAASAEQVFNALPTEEERRVARALFEDLIARRGDDFVRAPAKTRATLQQRIGGTRVDPVLAQFEEAGAISRIGSDDPADDRIEITDIKLVEQWPDLIDWLATRDKNSSRRDLLLQKAEQWNASGRRMADLASWADLKTIDRYLDETKLLDEFIQASKVNRRRRIFGAAIAATIIIGVILFFQLRVQSLDIEVESLGNEVASLDDETDQLRQDYNLASGELAPDLPLESQSPNLPPPAVDGGDVAIPDLPALKGAMWLGSVTTPQVLEPDTNGKFVPLARADKGTTYRARARIYLRTHVPDRDGAYISPDDKAIIPGGSLVVLTGKPNTYARPSGIQYWANVKVIPRVYIQYNGDKSPAIEALRQSLAKAGFEVPAAEHRSEAAGKMEVRFFGSPGREIAQALMEKLSASLEGIPGAYDRLQCRSLIDSQFKSTSTQVELWLDLQSRGTANPSKKCP